MKPAVDEMFPEGAGPYVDLDEVRRALRCRGRGAAVPRCGGAQRLLSQAGGSTGLLMDLAANEKAVHADFFNDFEDLFDDDDIQ
ncbi:CSN9 protein, partial [Prunella himalayana]|nr:CSN9 protein [Prunella himalayana]